jgi:hypothetical protein
VLAFWSHHALCPELLYQSLEGWRREQGLCSGTTKKSFVIFAAAPTVGLQLDTFKATPHLNGEIEKKKQFSQINTNRFQKSGKWKYF